MKKSNRFLGYAVAISFLILISFFSCKRAEINFSDKSSSKSKIETSMKQVNHLLSTEGSEVRQFQNTYGNFTVNHTVVWDFNNFSKVQAKLKVIGGASSELLDVAYIDLYSNVDSVNSVDDTEFEKVVGYSLYGFKNNLLYHEYYKKSSIGFEKIMELTLPVKMISLSVIQLMAQMSMEQIGEKRISSIFIERPNNRYKTGKWDKSEDFKTNLEIKLLSLVEFKSLANYIILSQTPSPNEGYVAPTCGGACSNQEGRVCDVPIKTCKKSGTVQCNLAGIQEKITQDNLSSGFTFNTSKLYDLRDNFLTNYILGQRYIDNYYIGNEYLNVSSLSPTTLQKIIAIMPEIYATIDKLNNPNYSGIIISNSFKTSLNDLFLDLKTYSSDSLYIDIFNQAIIDLNMLTNKNKADFLLSLN